ncbi:conserved exported hypothetical protein [Candidatus Propionivibrio aalborgensis]|uniref:DUF4124 domain-containing protein n=1 Tax=Candidatus Propionivibrio aalborgensis TaxID=1860101 RepID=A0A1A8XFI3_9RHOO|nr:DUF4124 domain-containing protein [Candidatus Propionivibrio aalborgensis]MBK7326833.1 DUF4124 domain-containing protein [Propionivibrio sp.]MBK7562872.1 DUF4124 domain-containing protein [Propionivibrio sp.]SBT03944.1 conserved exported hypothetical protein [Candidatus Propionivibrio aalborgensis]SBT03954.1 conserved exported hypothetical protein [Candidatus Propionivibrio aalborgensis]HRC60058.1 DUF4124 domain-containing protein [Candidatus Propionivibrio aalborgensis]
MKRFVFTLAVTALFAAAGVNAQVYQWKDENGKTIYSDKPPIGAPGQPQKIHAPSPAASSATQKTLADRDLEFRKRQKESQESAEKAQKEQSASAEKQQYCDNTRRRLQALESGERISMHDDKGERYYMDDAQREKEITKARQDIGSNCR